MKNFKKILTLLLVLIMSLTGTACDRFGGGEEEDDPTVTHLKVLNYNGGFGTQWLEEVKERFEEVYKDYSFEEGKKGVVIDIDRGKDNYYQVKKIIDSKICGKLFFDINLRKPFFDNKTIVYTLKHCNILKASEEELSYIIKNIFNDKEEGYLNDIKKVYTHFPNIELILLTCGEEGSYAYQGKDDILTYQEAFKVEVISTVGAGDCFGATFLVNYLNGDSIKECLYKANKAASIVVNKVEAI